MFKSIKRLLIAATGILAMSAPCAAGAFIRDTGGEPRQAARRLSRSSVRFPERLRRRGFQSVIPGWRCGVIVLLGAGAGATSVMRSKREPRPIAG